MANRVSEEERDQIIALYHSGLSCRAVGLKVNRADRTVWRMLVDSGVEIREARRQTDVTQYIGQAFGKWTILGFDSIRGNNRLYWLCKCACGVEQAIRARELIKGGSLGCNQCCHSTHSNAYLVKGWYMTSLVNKARSRNLELTVSAEYISNLFIEQGHRCALTRQPLTLSTKLKNWKIEQTASLDRIDSSQGYLPGNVQWVHKDVNRMKNNFTQKYFIEMCKRVATYEA